MPVRPWVLCAAMCVCAGAFPTSAMAQEESSPIVRARELMRSFEYDEAAAVLQDYIARDVPAADELDARRLLVIVWASSRQQDRAKEAAAQLYERDPGYELPDAARISPRIRSILAEAKRRAQAQPPRDLEVGVRRAGDDAVFRVTSETPAIVSAVEIMVRDDSDEEWTRLVDVESRGAVHTARTPQDDGMLQYYVRLHAPSGHVIAEAGTPGAPLEWREVLRSRDVRRDESSSVPLIVGIIAAVAVAGAAVGVGVTRPWDDGPSVAGTIELP